MGKIVRDFVVSIVVIAGLYALYNWYFGDDFLSFALLTLTSLGAILMLVQGLKRHGERETFRRVFGWAGERVPLFDILSLTHDGAAEKIKADRMHSAGFGPESLFLIRSGSSESKEQTEEAGKLVASRAGGWIHVRWDEIRAVRLHDLTDEAIAENVADRRSSGEKMFEAAFDKFVFAVPKTRLIPYAAYIVIEAEREGRGIVWIAAIPTEVKADLVNRLGGDATDPTAVGSYIEGKISDAVGEGQSRLAGGIIGEGAASGISDAIGILAPGDHATGSTQGARARWLAHLVAGRIRREVAARTAVSGTFWR